MKCFLLLFLMFIPVLLYGCNFEGSSSFSGESSSEAIYTDEQKNAIEVGNYFLENYNNKKFSEKYTYYINNPDERISHLDSSIVDKCKDNEFLWVSFYDEHTVLIYKGAYFQEAKGYLVTDGTKPIDVSEKSETFGFDINSMKISKSISDNLYSFRAGL